MKPVTFFTVLALLAFTYVAEAQHYNLDGTPDRRYRENKTTTISSFSAFGSTNSATRLQSGYQRSDGTAVSSHYKTESNSTNWDNFSTKGNSNPFTGESGSRARDYSNDARNYGSGQTIQTGSRGGQYYINGNGGKTYVPKHPLGF